MIIDELFSILIASVWFWSINSAKLVRLMMARDLSMLPLWALNSKNYIAISLVNFVLMIAQYLLPVIIFFMFDFKSAIIIIFLGAVYYIFANFVLQFVLNMNIVANYFIGLIATVSMTALIIF